MGNVVITAVKKNVTYEEFQSLKQEIEQFLQQKGFDVTEIHISFAE